MGLYRDDWSLHDTRESLYWKNRTGTFRQYIHKQEMVIMFFLQGNLGRHVFTCGLIYSFLVPSAMVFRLESLQLNELCKYTQLICFQE